MQLSKEGHAHNEGRSHANNYYLIMIISHDHNRMITHMHTYMYMYVLTNTVYCNIKS